MPKRPKPDDALRDKRIRNDIKVLRYLLENVDQLARGKKGSPEKLVVFYAGYTAMRSIWDAKTNGGRAPIGDPLLDEHLKRKVGKAIFRMDVEISHSIGEPTRTLLCVAPFKFWAKHILRVWG